MRPVTWAGTWTVPLASQASVSRVELLFFAESAFAQAPTGWPRRCSFRAPKLGDLPVERTVWTIASPRTLQADDCRRRPESAAPLLPAMRRPATLPHSGSGSSKKARRPFPAPPAARSMRSPWTIGPSRPSHGSRGSRASRSSWSPWDWPPCLIRRGLLWSWFARWPYVFGVGLGLAWWLWLVTERGGAAHRAGRVVVAIPSLAMVLITNSSPGGARIIAPP